MLSKTIASVGGCIGRRNAAPQIETGTGRAAAQGVVVEAGGVQQGARFPGLLSQIVTMQFAARLESGASLRTHCTQGIGHRRLRQVVQIQQSAGHQACGQRGVVVKRTTAGRIHVDVGFACDNGVEQGIIVLGRTQHGAATIGNTDCDDAGVVGAEVSRRKLRVEHLQAELGSLSHVLAPIGFGIVLRVGVFERDAGGGRRLRRKDGDICMGCRCAVALRTSACAHVDIIGARSLVGIGHRAATRQRPRCGHGDGAVDATRTRGRRDDEARFFRIEAIRQLQQHAM